MKCPGTKLKEIKPTEKRIEKKLIKRIGTIFDIYKKNKIKWKGMKMGKKLKNNSKK
jgi:hypothetical protein